MIRCVFEVEILFLSAVNMNNISGLAQSAGLDSCPPVFLRAAEVGASQGYLITKISPVNVGAWPHAGA
jgi:hypothetical protein